MPVASLVVAYLVGSIPFALLLARRWGTPDLHSVGSGNIGAANVLRASGVGAGVLVAVLDFAKGAAGVALAEQLSGAPSATALAGFAVVVGHVYPCWLRFRGGKGVATASGAFAVLAPLPMGVTITLFLIVVWTTKYISMGSIAASTVLPVATWLTGCPDAVVIAATASAALILFRHRANLSRIRSGTERRIGARV